MVKQAIQDSTMELQNILSGATSLKTTNTTAEKHPQKADDNDHVTTKGKLHNSCTTMTSKAESFTGVETITPNPTVFFLKHQSPTAHLSILRNPTRAYERSTPAFSPALGHASDTYIRFTQRQYLQDRVTVENYDYIETVKNTAHRKAQIKRYGQARRSLSRIQENHEAWIYSKDAVDNLCHDLHIDALFWRSFNEDRLTVINQDGKKEEQWLPNGQDRYFGQCIENEMQIQGRSINEWAELKKSVELLEQEARHQTMVKHREQWRRTKYVPELYKAEIYEDDSEDDSSECGHLYDEVNVPGVILSEVVAKDEAITTLPSSDIPHIKPANFEQRPKNLDLQAHALEKQPEKDFEIDTFNNKTTINQESKEMASTTPTTKEIVTETDAILSLADTLVSDLKERYEFYYTSSNVHMNTALAALRPSTLANKCTWIIRPLAITKKNLTPPPANELPAIRLTNPSGVTCELIESFQDLSDPWFEDYVAWRDEEQDTLSQAVQEWREKEETFDEYDRRLVCEEFWDQCLENDLKRVMEERKNWEDMEVVFEHDSENDKDDDNDDDDDDEWDEYSRSRSRSSSCTTLVSELEEDTIVKLVTEPNTEDKEEEEEEEEKGEEEGDEPPKVKTETEIAAELKVARANLSEFNTILANSVMTVKHQALADLQSILDAEAHTKASEEAEATKDRYAHDLSSSITSLHLHMSRDGLTPTDKSGFTYTSTQPTGPGSVTFVGAIRQFLTDNKRIHNRAFKALTEHIQIHAFRRMDFYKEVKNSMRHVTDLYRHVKSSRIFKMEVKEATRKMDDERAMMKELIHHCVAEEEHYEKMRQAREEQKKMAAAGTKGRAKRPVERVDFLGMLGMVGDMVGVVIGGKKRRARLVRGGSEDT